MEKKKIKKNDELVSNRVLSMFAAGAVLLWALSYLYKLFDYIPSHDTAISVCKILLIISCVGVISGLVWYGFSIKAKVYKNDKVITPLSISGFFAVVVICCGLLLYNYILGMRLIYLFIPAVVIYYLIYNVYQRSFFYLTVTHGFIALLLYFMSNCYDKKTLYIYVFISVIICILAVLISYITTKKKGVIGIASIKIKIFERNSIPCIKSSALIYGISALTVISSIFIPNYAIMYIFYAFIAFIVCCAVYFTIRLM